MCGEQKAGLADGKTHQGSSPRVRGTEITQILRFLWLGIIPACAGNRYESRLFNVFFWDHPRVCGEQELVFPMTDNGKGSSPRVRGTVRDVLPEVNKHGIIPACAGNSGRTTVGMADYRDHPRVCGEQISTRTTTDNTAGSSPRVRGTVQALSSCMHLPWDHPRVCGEQIDTKCANAAREGSSPRVRGTAVDLVFLSREGGIIPACAGNSKY